MLTLPEIKHSFDLTEDQLLIRDMVRDFAIREVAPLAHEVDEHHRFEKKTWETVEDRLVVIGAYRLGFRIAPQVPAGSTLTVWIDYDLPSRRRWLGRLGGSMYADWCVQQMLGSARSHFT